MQTWRVRVYIYRVKLDNQRESIGRSDDFEIEAKTESDAKIAARMKWDLDEEPTTFKPGYSRDHVNDVIEVGVTLKR